MSKITRLYNLLDRTVSLLEEPHTPGSEADIEKLIDNICEAIHHKAHTVIHTKPFAINNEYPHRSIIFAQCSTDLYAVWNYDSDIDSMEEGEYFDDWQLAAENYMKRGISFLSA